MSINLSDVLATQFSAEIKHRFDSQGVLRQTVRQRDASGAKSVQFNLMGRGMAAERTGYQTPIPVMNVTYTPVTISVSNYTASELTDIFLGNQVKFDERAELVETISGALGRRIDQLIINSMAGATLPKTVADDVSGETANLTVAAIRSAAELMDADGVPDGDRFLAVHPSGLHSLLSDSQATSVDFNNVKALVRGDLDTFYGFQIRKIGNRDEGGLPLDTQTRVRTNFAYHRQAIGLAVNLDVNVRIDWDEQYGAHRVTGFLSAGAGVIDDLGVVSIATSEA